MQGLRNVLTRSSAVAATGALWLCLTNCSGKAFDAVGGSGRANDGDGGSGVAGGGASSGGSESSLAGSGGSGNLGGTGGSAGMVSSSCDCGSGTYCRDGSLDCWPCSDLIRLQFKSPERLTTLSDNGHGSRFPRRGATGIDLLYRIEGAGLRYTADSSTSPGSNVMSTDATDSGPLLLDAGVRELATTLKSFNFVFDRTPTDAKRAIYFAQWSSGLKESEPAPAPFNSDVGDYSMAVARHPQGSETPRAFWMSDRGSVAAIPIPTLLTALLAAGASSEPVALSIERTDTICSPKDDPEAGVDPDLTPWVTPDGKYLLLSTTKQDANCEVAGEGKDKDLYMLELDPELGQPSPGVAATALKDVNSSFDDTDPSFSADWCDLYFASNRDGKHAIYRAHRR
jgi:hypothetical protein